MISAVVISIDDNSYIEKCLQQLDFVDQIVIVGTLNDVEQRKFDNKPQITFIENIFDPPDILLELGRLQCKGDWVLGLQADLFISEELKESLISETRKGRKKSVYWIKTELIFMGRLIKFSSYKKPWVPILWPNGNTQSYPKKKFKPKGLKMYTDFDTFNQRISALCKREAHRCYDNKKRPNWINLFWKPFWTLFKNFILNLGFLDGKEGFALAYIEAFATVKTQLFLWLKYRTIE